MALDVGPLPQDMAGRVIEFDIKTPCDEATIRANIAHALRLGLPEANATPPRLTIVANGPSARQAPLDGLTLALNGAMKLFLAQGKAPTYWAACDPQELVTQFLPDDPPKATIYLVASKCHPAVFEKLKGRDVRVWHVSDFVDDDTGLRPVPCALTITTIAIPLMLQLGFPRQHIWGWDACYGDDGSNHAVPQAHHEPEIIELDLDGRIFRTTRSWAAEAQDACNKMLPIYRYLGLDLVIQGDGLVRALNDYPKTAA